MKDHDLKLIAHRANFLGRSPLENSPKQVDKCIELGFECEVDIRLIDGDFYLGHDSPDFKVDFDWISKRSTKLWLHCKDFNSLNFFVKISDSDFNFFWHDKDQYTLTNKGYIWAYPGVSVSKNCIAVLPETWLPSQVNITELDYLGICSDFIENYRINKH